MKTASWFTSRGLAGRIGISLGTPRGQSGFRLYTPDPYSVLEPSAGLGAIARLVLQAPGAELTCVEVHAERAQVLTSLCPRVRHRDFLDLTPRGLGSFDRIVMNPPFDGGRDIDHVVHALKFLKPGGILASVMSAGVEFREDRKTADFRAQVERYGGHFSDLPPESFAESGTRVNTVIVKIRAPRG